MLDNGVKAVGVKAAGTKAEAVKETLDYHALNAMLNLYDADGKIRFDADRMAARQYFLQHVNQNTVFFHNLDEKLRYLVDEGYYEPQVLDQYSKNFQRAIWDAAYERKFRPWRVQILHLLYAEDPRRAALP